METGNDERTILSSNPARRALLSLLIVYSAIQNGMYGEPRAFVPGVLLTLAALCLQWRSRWFTRRGPAPAFAVCALLGISSIGVILGLDGSLYIIVFFLLGWVSYRLPASYSASYTVLNIAAAAWILLDQHRTLEAVMTHCLILAAVYLLFLAGRLRRTTRTMKERHLQELTSAHQELEAAYRSLRQAHEELEETSEQALRYAVLEERSRIAADIHDSIGHGLTSVIVQLQALPYMIEAAPDEARSTLKQVTDVARGCLQDVRTVVHEMGLVRPGEGLKELRKLADAFSERSGIPVAFTMDIPGTIAPEQLYVLYRILQEALTNMMRHAQATQAEVRLIGNKEGLVLTIRDNGVAQGPIQPGFGLTAMRERCAKAGGRLTVTPLAPHGLEITASLPFSAATPNNRGE
ncbi:sensor histidine kinase [Paenibacillus sp. Y412MC10]|uniref:sensor histidine kinase n=1 Tax=Geobacillus sp. (strain Y412MC10) TaxID=481743 RepID=UPI0011A6E735|nr:sensor histidine kinase [Paenibacillus sp. Y412MC10]